MLPSKLLVLAIINYFCYSNAVELSRDYIPISDPLYNLAKRLQDAQQADTWIIRTHPLLQRIPDQKYHIEGQYVKHRFQDLAPNEQGNVWHIVCCISMDNWEHANAGCKNAVKTTLMDSSQTSIWKRPVLKNYLISYRQSAAPFDRFWAIGHENSVVCWEKNTQPPEPSEWFPLLINEHYDTFCKLHGNYSAMRQENQILQEEVMALNRKIEEQRIRITELEKGDTTPKTTDGIVGDKMMWSGIVGAGTMFVTAIVICCGFKFFYSNRKKEWEIQRSLLNDSNLQHDNRKIEAFIEPHRRVMENINNRRKIRDDPDVGEHEIAVNDAAGRQFNDVLVNSAAVHDVLMDDVVEQMETEGVGGRHYGCESQTVLECGEA